MTTDDLRALVKQAATATKYAKLWPNGLGFDARGTSYRYVEAVCLWCARRGEFGTSSYRYGEGKTPLEAKRAAGIGGRSVNSRGGVAP